MRMEDIPGLGPKRVKVLKSAGVSSVADLLHYIPRQYLDRTRVTPLDQWESGEEIVALGEIISQQMHYGRKMRLEVVLDCFSDESLDANLSGSKSQKRSLSLVFFHYVEGWQKKLKAGLRLSVAGRLQFFNGFQLVHPELKIMQASEAYEGEILPVYPLTEEMKAARMEQAFFRKIFPAFLQMPLVQALFARKGLPTPLLRVLHTQSEFENLQRLHMPASLEDVAAARDELKRHELLPFAVRLETRIQSARNNGISRGKKEKFVHEALGRLPFTLTNGQKQCWKEIRRGLESEDQFKALLQGDVGSGKTVLSLMAALSVLEGGEQVVVMAPTEILIRQHFKFFEHHLSRFGLKCALVTGDLTGERRKDLYLRISQGEFQCVLGTHALFGDDLPLCNPGLIIIDEQHRFGVEQREKLIRKGKNPDVIVMSATPIPRSLTMTLYGDLQPVVLQEKPVGRLPVKTRLVQAGRRSAMVDYVLKRCTGSSEDEGRTQAYWVVPRVADLEDQVHSVESLYRELTNFSSLWSVQFVHGRMDEDERENVLRRFSEGSLDVLVATTVVEVGIDVPNANIMVIESPERFGLAQLHQLRGRVGRAGEQAWCFLQSGPENTATERLEAFCATNDGFEIAELDLRNRGAGNLEGAEQSGLGTFLYTDVLSDTEMILEMRTLARNLLQNLNQFKEEESGTLDKESIQLLERWQNESRNQDGIH